MREVLLPILVAAILALPFSGLARPAEPIIATSPGATGCCPMSQSSACGAPAESPGDAHDRPCCPTDDSGRCVPICCLIAKTSVATSRILALHTDDRARDPLPRPSNQRADSLALAPDPPVPIA